MGEVDLQSKDGEGEDANPSAALSQKAALQMPFAFTTPPVEMRLERSAELVRAKPFHLLAQTALGLSLLRKRGRSKREIINNSSAIDVQSAAEHILNRLALLYLSYLY